MGACLHVLHLSCQHDILESTAGDVVNVFSRSLESTESPELQVNLYTFLVLFNCLLDSQDGTDLILSGSNLQCLYTNC